MSSTILNRTWERRIEQASSKGWRWAICAALIISTIGGLNVMWHWISPTPPPDVVTPTRQVYNQNRLVASFAKRFVQVWLTTTAGQEGNLRTYVSSQVKVEAPTTTGVVISAPDDAIVTYDPATSNDDVSSFSVVVPVMERPYAAAAPTPAFYQVPVTLYEGGTRATAMPSKIGAPPKGMDVPLAYPVSLSNASKGYALASGFVTSYLTTGQGLERFISADAPLSAPGGYAQVRVLSVSASDEMSDQPSDGARVHLLVSVTAISSQYAPTTMQYPLALIAASGTWSVESIDPAPLIDWSSAQKPSK